jgi:hypothetical protein
LTAAAGIEDIQNHSIDCQADGRMAHPRMMICAALTPCRKPPYTQAGQGLIEPISGANGSKQVANHAAAHS